MTVYLTGPVARHGVVRQWMCDCLSGCQTVSVSLSLIYRCAYFADTSFRSCDICGDVCCTTHSDSTRSPACCRAAAVAMFRSTCASASLASRFASRGMLMWQWLACEKLTQFPARRLQHERCVSRGDAVVHSSFCGGCPSLAEGECRVMVSVCLRSFDG